MGVWAVIGLLVSAHVVCICDAGAKSSGTKMNRVFLAKNRCIPSGYRLADNKGAVVKNKINNRLQ